ncbi:hypothetical protein CfE428DRAFT_5981 [Chthoniobacter flavus Ellin428]|uniref:Uncharacterized protein n=1 Tax=Chthoniobacter flavus Ellin428 TaxID=497964 RepID=B4DAP0_9BACT|nr:hypothetical protein [Chthoniobacter flavus]EDY16558.1 hypothetical protein CfE428DRAFT_5981 [Chthoniobacter flavus Ellin428]TCO82454.1 hypothetical protein EV701_1472 [Chthoniobacter flavus]
MRILPITCSEWARLAFHASELAVVGGTICRSAVLLSFTWQHGWQQEAVSAVFHRFNCVAFVALAISTLAVWRTSRALAMAGWISLFLCGILVNCYPAID